MQSSPVSPNFFLIIWTEILWCRIILFHAGLQNTVRDSKCCIMKLDRSMSLTLIIFLMSSTPRMVARGWLLFWCICTYRHIHSLCSCDGNWMEYVLIKIFSLGTDQMLKKGVRLFSLMQMWTAVLYHGIMSFQNVPEEVSLSNQRWEMRFFSIAWNQMPLWTHWVYMVSPIFGNIWRILDLSFVRFCSFVPLSFWEFIFVIFNWCCPWSYLYYIIKFYLYHIVLAGGCPVIKGNKWSSTKWMHIHEYKAWAF